MSDKIKSEKLADTIAVSLCVVRKNQVVYYRYVGSSLMSNLLLLRAAEEDTPLEALDINQQIISSSQTTYVTTDSALATGLVVGASDIPYSEAKFIHTNFKGENTIASSGDLTFNFIVQY